MEQSNIVVSIICNTYNHEPYIRQSLEGFVMQKTDFAFEVLIHDDASTDKTADIIREYEAQYPDIIKPIYQTENQYSQKTGIMKTFQYPREGDDYWIDPLKLQKQVDFLEANPDYSMCFHNAMVLNEVITKKERIRSFNSYRENKEFTVFDILDEWYVPTASMLFRKDARKETPSFFSGDYVLSLVLASVGKIYYMDQYMSVYRLNNGGISNSISANKWANQMCGLLDWYDCYTSNQYKKRIERRKREINQLAKYCVLKQKCIFFPILFMPCYTFRKIKNKINMFLSC